MHWWFSAISPLGEPAQASTESPPWPAGRRRRSDPADAPVGDDAKH